MRSEVSFRSCSISTSSARFGESRRSRLSHAIRDLAILEKHFGRANWRKLKGFATVRLEDGTLSEAEVHWYEAHGIGKRWMKIKRYLD